MNETPPPAGRRAAREAAGRKRGKTGQFGVPNSAKPGESNVPKPGVPNSGKPGESNVPKRGTAKSNVPKPSRPKPSTPKPSRPKPSTPKPSPAQHGGTWPARARNFLGRPLPLLKLAGGVVADALRPLILAVAGVVRRFVLPVLQTLSPLGWLALFILVLMWILGASFGWQEALVVALLCAIVLLASVAFIIGRSSYAVSLDLARTRVAVGDDAVGGITVSNSSSRPLIHSTLELPVGKAVAAFPVPRLRPGQVHEDLFTIPTSRRSVIMVGPAVSVRSDPLELLRRQVRWTEPVELFVHPRTVALGSPAAGFIRDLEGMVTKDLSNSDVSFHALRDYVPGDDRRHIHWKTTARTGQLMVRQFEETRRAHLAIALSVKEEEFAHEEELELAISVACSIGRQALVEQRELDMLTQGGPLRCATGRSMLDDATRIQSSSGRKDAVHLAHRLADTVPNASVTFFVVGSGVTPGQLRSCSSSVPPGVRAIALRVVSGAAPARAAIGELSILTLGSLDDLALVLRKAAA